jgi:hypothetical protein
MVKWRKRLMYVGELCVCCVDNIRSKEPMQLRELFM